MFSDLEAVALILAARSIDEERRREHAARTARELGLDPRLEPLVPLPPRRRKLAAQYDFVIEVFEAASRLPEPRRTTVIEEIVRAAGGGDPRGSSG